MTAVFGIAGWSGGGKTSLILRLLPALRARGFVVGVLKHAHHAFDIDHPGKDSRRFREAGCRQVGVSSSRRRAFIYESEDDEAEPDVFSLLAKFDPACNLILVEGYKDAPLPKLEVWRSALERAPLAAGNPHVKAIAADSEVPQLPAHCALLPLNDAEAVAEFVAKSAA